MQVLDDLVHVDDGAGLEAKGASHLLECGAVARRAALAAIDEERRETGPVDLATFMKRVETSVTDTTLAAMTPPTRPLAPYPMGKAKIQHAGIITPKEAAATVQEAWEFAN